MKPNSIKIVLAALLLILATNPAQAEDQDQAYMRRAIALARQAMERGDQPFGALVVKDGKVLAATPNTVHTDNNVTHHGETNALAACARTHGSGAARGATLYTSCEPCAMCCGAIYLFGVKRVVYGLSDPRFARITGWTDHFDPRKFFGQMVSGVELTGPVLEDEAAKVMQAYVDKMESARKP
jgi:tRNA(Arg) A34 adenosine deaminase TadA